MADLGDLSDYLSAAAFSKLKIAAVSALLKSANISIIATIRKRAGAMTDRKIDPFDVEALEKSLNDSATRVSTIWVTFLIFSLYLLTAATTVTHRQLFLAEPVKLPVLNIDLPLLGFFFLAPILFVILHAYVLLQVILLARTAATYNEAVDKSIADAADNARVRQRLANTLFAQIFAGSPRERAGWLGWLLKAMAWITLAITPILILLVFQFMFLPYHSHLATWTHRLLIVAELAVAFLLWPLVLDARRDFEWARIWLQFKRTAALPRRLFGPKDRRHDEWVWLRQQAFPLASCVLFVLISMCLATFPGEPHVNLATGHTWSSVQCDRWFSQKFDRLDLFRVDVVHDEKLAKIEGAMSDRPTPSFRGRDLACTILSGADLRRVDLANARLSGALLSYAKLQGASLERAQLDGASLETAQLQGASLMSARLRGASLSFAALQSASLDYAEIQGAILFGTQLEGASLESAELQGAILERANLQGAFLDRAQLQGAYLLEVRLQGASLREAQLQGAYLGGAQLQGASLQEAQLQGADLDQSAMAHADLADALVWRAKNAACGSARVSGHRPNAMIADEPVPSTQDELASLIERWVAGIPETGRPPALWRAKGIPDPHVKEEARERMRAALIVDPSKDDTAEIAKVWSDCEEASKKKSRGELDAERALFLSNLVCNAQDSRKAIANGVVRNWLPDDQDQPLLAAQLARGLLGLNGDCAATKDLDEPTKERLHAIIAASVKPMPAPPPPPTSPAR
jgi:uncharacterized protein YjbI with pentapeptide repeats